MTDATARAVANLAVASAGVAAAYVVLTTPPLRRLAALAARWWLGASVPIYLLGQIRSAWVESGRRA
jgi:hypothetical protein